MTKGIVLPTQPGRLFDAKSYMDTVHRLHPNMSAEQAECFMRLWATSANVLEKVFKASASRDGEPSC